MNPRYSTYNENHDVVERVADAITRHQMFPAGGRIGVAVSGGADSVCLLHVLRELQQRFSISLTVIHVNHLLRGPDSDTDEQFVRDLAASLHVPVVCKRFDIAALASVPGANLEETGRDVRRSVFLAEIEEGNVERVALAHTRSDQAETVLFRFLRGSYTTGLAGMRPITREGFVRPLLDVDRVEIEEYLKDRKLEWREDLSNRDLRFDRNRIRHHWMPALASEWNPNLPRLLAQHSVLAQEDEAYWAGEVDRIAPSLLEQSQGAVIVDVRPFESLPNSLARRVIRRIFEIIRGNLRQIDFRHIDEALGMIRGPSGHFRSQVPGVDMLRSFEWVRFAKPLDAPVPRDFELRLTVPADVRMPDRELGLSLELIERQVATASLTESKHATLKADLDWNLIQSAAEDERFSDAGLLTLRNWRPGDVYRPVGDQNEHKLKTLFHDARIPLWDRRNWPVLTIGGHIIWSRKFGAATNFAANTTSTTVLRISEKSHAS